MRSACRPTGVSVADWDSLIFAVEEYRDAVAEHRVAVDGGDLLGGLAEPAELAEAVADRCVRLLLTDSGSTP